MNILVTGANGQLGTALRGVVQASGCVAVSGRAASAEDSVSGRAVPEAGDRWIFTDITQAPGVETVYLDVTDATAVRIVCRSEKIDVIVNCAGYTDVDKAEEDHATADLLNHRAVAGLAEAACATGAFLIHISTDYVFRGDRPIPYAEDAAADPTGVYGATKLAGERAILASGCRHLILRTAWMYSPWGRNFVRTMLQQMRTRPSVQVVCDQIGTPTYAPDLAELIVGIIAGHTLDDCTGIYHYSGEGAVSWYDFAMAIRDLAGLTACDLRPCRTSEYPTKARRPAYSVLDKAKVRRTFGCRIPYWRDSLALCLRELEASAASPDEPKA